MTVNHRLGALGYLNLVDAGAPRAYTHAGHGGLLDLDRPGHPLRADKRTAIIFDINTHADSRAMPVPSRARSRFSASEAFPYWIRASCGPEVSYSLMSPGQDATLAAPGLRAGPSFRLGKWACACLGVGVGDRGAEGHRRRRKALFRP